MELNSTLLKAAAYADQAALLELEFRSGAVYRYFDVPAPVWQEFLRAESKGRYFSQHIRNRFACVKTDPGAAAQPAIPDTDRMSVKSPA